MVWSGYHRRHWVPEREIAREFPELDASIIQEYYARLVEMEPIFTLMFRTFEQYASELETGKLEWSPPHKSETFWKENASKLEENNYVLLRQVKQLKTDAIILICVSLPLERLHAFSVLQQATKYWQLLRTTSANMLNTLLKPEKGTTYS